MPDAKRRRLRSKQAVPCHLHHASAGNASIGHPRPGAFGTAASQLATGVDDLANNASIGHGRQGANGSVADVQLITGVDATTVRASAGPCRQGATEAVVHQRVEVEAVSNHSASICHGRQGASDTVGYQPGTSADNQCCEAAMASPLKKAKHYVCSDIASSTSIGHRWQGVTDAAVSQQAAVEAANFYNASISHGRQGAGSPTGVRSGSSHEPAPAAAVPDGGSVEAVQAPSPQCVSRHRIAQFRSKIILVVGKCPLLAAELRKRCGGGIFIVSWEGPFNRHFRPNTKETMDWALRVADGAVAALVWSVPACLGAFNGDCLRNALEPWGTRDASPGGAGLLRVEALACNIGIEFMRCIADAGGTGVQLFRKSDNGLLREHCARRLGSEATVIGEAVVLGRAPFPDNAAAGSDRASQQEAARAVLLRVASVKAVRLSTEEEDLWHSSIAGDGPAGAGGILQPAERKRKPLAFPIVEPASICPDLDAARLRGEEAGGIPDVAEEHFDDDGPGDCWCGLEDDQQEDAKDDNVCETEALHQLIERNRSAALARRRAREEKQLQQAVADATVTVQNEGGVVSHSRLITLPGFAMR